MKIQEFRDLLKGADRERLEKAFSECYKQFSKAKKEEIDDLVRDILSGGEENSRKKDTTADFAALERDNTREQVAGEPPIWKSHMPSTVIAALAEVLTRS